MAQKSEASIMSFIDSAKQLCHANDADAILLLLEQTVDFGRLKKTVDGELTFVIAASNRAIIEEADEANIPTVLVEAPEASVHDRLTQAILDSVAKEYMRPGSTVVTIYSGFDSAAIDTISVVKLNERLGRLTARDLRKLETDVPLDTLRVVVDLAVEIGRDGREGKPVGTMFVVGDHRKVLKQSRPGGFDPVKGYPVEQRNLFDPRVREGIKEVAQLDGMFVVSSTGIVMAACRIVDTAPVELTMTSGLGSRHFAGAAISKNTKAIAVVVSESSGTVRIFQGGEVVLRIEPMRSAMKWKDFDQDESKDRD